MDGSLKGFVLIQANEALIGYPKLLSESAEFMTSVINAGETFEYAIWETTETLPFRHSFEKKKLPEFEAIEYDECRETACIVSHVPAYGKKYNREKERVENVQMAVVTAIKKLDASFAQRVSRFTGTEVNIYTKNGLSVGTKSEYKEFDLKTAGNTNNTIDVQNRPVYLSNISIQNEDFAQGTFLLKNENETIGAIVALNSYQRAKENTRQVIITMAIVAVVCILAMIPIAFLLARNVTGPVQKSITYLMQRADRVSNASKQVAASSQSSAEGSSIQASSIEETTSSLEEMSSMTKQNAAHADNADKLSQTSNGVINQAAGKMNELVDNMARISKSSQDTFKIVKTIDEIAFQTNLLALNASVEAARAGEAGSGFAVVANEVRNLAVRAAEAAKNTSELIEETVKGIQDCSDMAAESNQSFAEAAQNSMKIQTLVAEIAAASNEQAKGIEQINQAVVEVEKVTQTNAANSEQSAAVSQEMRQQAERIREAVNNLKHSFGVSLNGKTTKKTTEKKPKSLPEKNKPLKQLDYPNKK